MDNVTDIDGPLIKDCCVCGDSVATTRRAVALCINCRDGLNLRTVDDVKYAYDKGWREGIVEGQGQKC